MADQINLSCQFCGAMLQVDKDMVHAKCPYCGQDTIIRASEGKILELHSRCPICQRNDRTKKVSSIMTSTGENRAYFAIPARPDRPRATAISPPPQSPVMEILKTNNTYLIASIVAAFIAGMSFLCAISDLQNNASGVIYAIIFGVVAFFIFRQYRNINKTKEQTQTNYQEGMKDYQNKVREYNEAVQRQHAYQEEMYQKWIANWQAAVEKWNKLYYCERDDCVFIPGCETSAPLKELEKFCYQRD